MTSNFEGVIFMSVKQKDDWNAFLYDGKHSFVSKYGSSLVELLAPKKGEKVLDVGCGTGDLASEIERRGAVVLGIDLVLSKYRRV